MSGQVGFELILRGGTVVTPTGLAQADIGVAEGSIVAVDRELGGPSGETIDATGLHIFPGVIDAHVHFNEPGRAEWEGLETGTRALAAGGAILFFDMPLNAHPPTLDAESFRLKLAAAERKSLVDFAFWGGLVPGNLEHLEELAECGVVGFKAFMANSGIDDFSCVDDRTLREGMKRAARLGLPVAVHAESDALTRQLTEERLAQGRISIRDYLESRPMAAELEAIRRALDLAGDTGCALHVVHVSGGAGIELVLEGRRRGVDVSCETCPHYLTLTGDDMEQIGALAKCAPPLRSAEEQKRLRQHLLAGEITTVGSDHSPSPPEMKHDANFFKIWGGISGGQHTLPLLLTAAGLNFPAGDRSLDAAHCPTNVKASSSSSSFNRPVQEREGFDILPLLASLVSERVAARFKLPRTKGRIVLGADADLALVDLEQNGEVRREDLFYRHPQSPYVGRRLRGRVVRTLLRGNTVFRDGKITGKGLGRFVRPIK